MKYSEREAGITCDCGSHADAVITACRIKTAGMARITPPDVGPLSKKSKAYQKQQDDNRSKYYAPDQTFGQGSVNKFKETKRRESEALKGKTDFTK